MSYVFCVMFGMIFIVIFVVFSNGVKIIRPYEQGLLEVLGTYKRILYPGFNYVPPIVSRVNKVDLRIQTIPLEGKKVFTKDNTPVHIDMKIRVKVQDAKKAWYDIDNYTIGTKSLAQEKLKTIVGKTESVALVSGWDQVNKKIRNVMEKDAELWGVKVVSVEMELATPWKK